MAKEIMDSEGIDFDEEEEAFNSIFSESIQKVQDGEMEKKERTLTIDDRNSMRGGSIIARGKSVNVTEEITLEDFDILLVLGRGAFGKVFLSRF